MTTDLNRFDNELYWSTPDAGLDRPVIGIIAASGGTLMFDACRSHRHAVELKQALAAHGLRPPDYAVISHSHADHWFGLVDFETASVCSRACQATTKSMMTMDWSREGCRRLVDDGKGNAFLADILDKEYGIDRERIPLRSPDVGIHGELTIVLGSVMVAVREIASSHSGDAVILSVPEKTVVFLGDVLQELRDLLVVLAGLNAEWFIDSQVETHLGNYVRGLQHLPASPPGGSMNMESRLRYRFFGPEQALEGAGVRSAQTVLDIGCGTGFWNGTISWTPSKLCKAVDFTLANGSAFAMRGYRHRKQAENE